MLVIEGGKSYLALSDIVADSAFNCRDVVTQLSVIELVKSIRALGYLIQPVVVRALGTTGKFQLIAGYCRFKSYGMLFEEDPVKWGRIEVSVKECDDVTAFRINLTENLQRSQLNIKEEARACERLMDEGMSSEEIIKELGKSMGWLQIRKQVIDLPLSVQDDVVAYNMTQSQIKELWQAPSDAARFEMCNKVKAARDKGEKITRIVTRVRPPDKKLKPTEAEVLAAMQKVAETFDGRYSAITRAMAWCLGNITDADFYADMAKTAERWKNIPGVL